MHAGSGWIGGLTAYFQAIVLPAPNMAQALRASLRRLAPGLIYLEKETDCSLREPRRIAELGLGARPNS